MTVLRSASGATPDPPVRAELQRCSTCGGTGSLGPDWDEYVCPWCHGTGVMSDSFPATAAQQPSDKWFEERDHGGGTHSTTCWQHHPGCASAPDAGMAALTRLLDRQERDRLAVRAAHYANDARNIVARVALYEDVHPDDAPCLESLLRAVPDIAWRGHDAN